MPERDARNPLRYLHSTKTKYEFQFGYSRAVRHGSVIRVAGTAGLDEEGTPLSGGIVEQTRRALEIIKAAIEDLGGKIEDTIMTRVYVADTSAIESVAVVHGEFFRDIRPATTIVQVAFIDPRILVEIEAEAVYSGAAEGSADAGAEGGGHSGAAEGSADAGAEGGGHSGAAEGSADAGAEGGGHGGASDKQPAQSQ